MRNIKKEYNWSKQKYETITARIDKQIGHNLKLKLKKDKKSIANWITENAKDYLNKK